MEFFIVLYALLVCFHTSYVIVDSRNKTVVARFDRFYCGSDW